ncbi:MAG TPA: hypothetical protein PJ993_00250 [Candidatus Saccharibacteria bacterium]|nr:hypothetical protein [Candidatus Saccharibacteria bacterium]HMT39356.1 hypothetical protein [Candidatus Saccharibacteria bacterium]
MRQTWFTRYHTETTAPDTSNRLFEKGSTITAAGEPTDQLCT